MSQALLSVEQAAQRLGGVSRWTIYAWLAKGRLRKTKIGSQGDDRGERPSSLHRGLQSRTCRARAAVMSEVHYGPEFNQAPQPFLDDFYSAEIDDDLEPTPDEAEAASEGMRPRWGAGVSK